MSSSSSLSREKIHMYLFAELCNKHLLECEENIGIKLTKKVGITDPVFFKQHKNFSTDYMDYILDNIITDKREEFEKYTDNELYRLYTEQSKLVGLNAYYNIQNIVELEDFIVVITFISSRDMNTISIENETFDISVKINRKKYISPGHFLCDGGGAAAAAPQSAAEIIQGYITPKIWNGYEAIVEKLVEFNIYLNKNIPKEIPITEMGETFQFVFGEIASFSNPPFFKRGSV